MAPENKLHDPALKARARAKIANPIDSDSENPVRQGGTEDLMVTGKGGTLPLKGEKAPDYYSKTLKSKKP